MQRILKRAPIAEALALLPLGIRRRVEHADWLVGVDPVFAGLHSYTDASYGRSHRDTAHVAYPYHQNTSVRGATTVVIPGERSLLTFVHELGHVLDQAIDFERHVPDVVSWYAGTDSAEAFAEAFTLWIAPDLCAEWPGHYNGAVLANDAETLALFEELAR
jgi:hypothetical protein